MCGRFQDMFQEVATNQILQIAKEVRLMCRYVYMDIIMGAGVLRDRRKERACYIYACV